MYLNVNLKIDRASRSGRVLMIWVTLYPHEVYSRVKLSLPPIRRKKGQASTVLLYCSSLISRTSVWLVTHAVFVPGLRVWLSLVSVMVGYIVGLPFLCLVGWLVGGRIISGGVVCDRVMLNRGWLPGLGG